PPGPTCAACGFGCDRLALTSPCASHMLGSTISVAWPISRKRSDERQYGQCRDPAPVLLLSPGWTRSVEQIGPARCRSKSGSRTRQYDERRGPHAACSSPYMPASNRRALFFLRPWVERSVAVVGRA